MYNTKLITNITTPKPGKCYKLTYIIYNYYIILYI